MTTAKGRTILLVAPNVSARMGGEAIKALSFLRQLHADGYNVVQVVHERCRAELTRDHPALDVRFAPESRFQRWLFRLTGGNWLVGALDAVTLRRTARRVARERDVAIVHMTSPISPVFPHLPVPEAPVVIGPINGNIFYPPGFGAREGRLAPIKKRLFPWAQWGVSRLARGKQRADALLIAGGERTRRALEPVGLDPGKLIEVLDSGVAPELERYPPIDHRGRSGRFVFFGRLIGLKGCDLAIRALTMTSADVELDIIGGGEEEAALASLAVELGVADRVRFVGWVPNGPELFERLRSYRGFVFPSLREANGIVIQEAMMLGLAIVALDWGGPAELLDAETGVLIAPHSPDHVVEALAETMERLTGDASLANSLGRAARAKADAAGFVWPRLARAWLGIYDDVLAARGKPPLAS